VLLRELSAQEKPAGQVGTPQKLPKWTILLNLFLLFHLSVMFITPNKENYFGYRLFSVLEPYVNFFEFSANWTFFSPDPALPVYIDWKIFDREGNELKAGTFPDIGNPFIIGDRFIRRVSATRFLLIHEGNLRKSLVPYLCRETPKSFSVRLSQVFMHPPRLVEIIEGKKDAHDESGTERSSIGLEYCEDGTDTKSL
jgi:hypothetical protein